MRISTKAAEAAKPGTKLTDDLVIPGGGALALVIKEKTKRWVIRTRSGGKDTSATLGYFPAMSVAQARERALEIGTGQRPDPRRHGGSLKELLEGYVKSLGERPTATTANNLAKWLLGREWEHPLAAKKANQIEPDEIAGLLRDKVQAGATTSVNRARATLHAAYAWGAKRDLDPRRPAEAAVFAIKSNPVTLVPRIAEFERARDTVISQADLKAIWKELTARGAAGAFGRLAMLTLQRLDQLAAATDEGDTLTIIDRKGRGAREKFNTLPVTKEMRAALKDGALSLPGGRAVLSESLKPRGYVGPDLRRTAETYLAERGFSGEDRGRLLSHGLEVSALVRRHYDKSENIELKARMLAEWQAYVTGKKR